MPAKQERDAQRSRVYAWERETFGKAMHTESLTLPECRTFAAEVYGRRVVVRDGRGTRRALAYTHGPGKINLPKWARNRIVICHEIAHLVVARIDQTLPAHGGIFLREYFRLLEKYGGQCAETLIESARAAGLRVAK